MKLSRYNHIYYTDNYAYWYNALCNTFFRLTIPLSKKIEYLVQDLSQFEVNVKTMYVKLLESGFIVDDDVDELNLVRQRYDDAVNSKDYFMVVLPTLNCNFRCWYCIQDHIPTKMSDLTFISLKKHIDHMIDVEHITLLHLEWFGGEPFMYFKQVIEPLNRYAISKCNESGIPFVSSATTNGYFLTEKVAQKLTELSFRHFQITLDGEKQFHDKVKFMKGCNSAFERVLNNINNLLTINPEVTIYLRINYTQETLTPKIVDDVCNFIDEGNRKRVVITPKKVWQAKVENAFTTNVIDMLNKFSIAGFGVSRFNFSSQATPCYVNKKYYNAINFNGNVVKCTACNDLYETSPKGVLKENGIIGWTDSYDVKCRERSFENEKCLSCNKLPVCMGVCPRDHIAKRIDCKWGADVEKFNQELLDYLIHQYD